jgi:hypothetical protein
VLRTAGRPSADLGHALLEPVTDGQEPANRLACPRAQLRVEEGAEPEDLHRPLAERAAARAFAIATFPPTDRAFITLAAARRSISASCSGVGSAGGSAA